MNRRSVVAVIAGVLAIIVGSILVDMVLHAAGIFPPMGRPITDTHALLATSYRIVISIGGAWLTARLAPDKPMKHALILGGVGAAFGLIGVAMTWNQGLGPRWFPILLVALAIPQSWAGGKIHEMQSGRL